MSPAATTRKPKHAKVKAKTKAPAVVARTGKPIHYELLGVALILLGLMIFAAAFWQAAIPSFIRTTMQWCFGIYGAWGIGFALILLGASLMMHLKQVAISRESFGMALIFLVTITFLQLRELADWRFGDVQHYMHTAGGLFGGTFAVILNALFGKFAWIVLLAITLVGVSLMTEVPLWMILGYPMKSVFRLWKFMIRHEGGEERSLRAADRAARVAELKAEELKRGHRSLTDDTDEELANDPFEMAKTLNLPPVKPTVPDIAAAASSMPEKETTKSFEVSVPAEEPEEKEPVPRITGVPSRGKPDQLQFSDEAIAPTTRRPYELPPVELLNLTPKTAKQNKDDTKEKIAILENTLSSFSIDAKVVGVERGPRVTRFEIVPPPGVRVNRISNLADDIALALSALDVRVEAPVPGKGVVGIEVPNAESVIVDLREILDSDVMRKSKSPLTFALGRDIAGHPRVSDLTKAPHLLIAGQTNSGKSVCINTLLCSLLMRCSPQQVKFLLVDPKRVELSLFQEIPHLIAPVAYDAKHAAGLLRWAIREMEQRYEMFAEKGVRNIIGYNEQARMEVLEELPYIVIIIDELADLMMQAAGEFEASICRIAQLARATGIHLVVATQRPSVNVITGTIKANIPSRISFAVASQVDSRTILDMNGAERLVGQGDMLYLPVDAAKPSRIQGCYVSEKEIYRIVEHVKAQGRPHFSDEIAAIEDEAFRANDDSSGSASNEPEDEFFAKALDYVRATKYASTSMLQRKFRIGYTRAARLMDEFEARGYVGPGQGSKPREVIFAPTTSVTGAVPGRENNNTPVDSLADNGIWEEDE